MINPVIHLLGELNWGAVIVATIVPFVLGYLWYGPLFGKAWMAASGVTKESMGGSARPLIMSFFLTLGTAIILGMAVERFDIVYWPNGITLGLGLAIGLYAFNLCSDFLFEGRPMKLLYIQAGYRVLCAAAMGGILAAWR